MVLKYYAEPIGATTYLKTLGIPNSYIIFHISMQGFGLQIKAMISNDFYQNRL